MAAFKLTKQQATELDQLAEAFQPAREELWGFLDELASDWEAAFSDKSERWQEGERGQEAQERIDMVRGWADEIPAEGEPAVDTESLT